MKALYYVFLFTLSGHIDILETKPYKCNKISDGSGVLRRSGTSNHRINVCWSIYVNSEEYLQLTIDELEFVQYPCQNAYLKISAVQTTGTLEFCSHNSASLPRNLTYHDNVEIEFLLPASTDASIAITYSIISSEIMLCQDIKSENGMIRSSASGLKRKNVCWTIYVPEDKYLQLIIVNLVFKGMPCENAYLRISDKATSRTSEFCSHDSLSLPRNLTLHSDVRIEILLPAYIETFLIEGHGFSKYAFIDISYSIRSLNCEQSDMFHCSYSTCVYQYQRCDGVKDCANGNDEDYCDVTAIKGANLALANVTEFLRRSRSSQFGWGENTHSAIVALHLSGNVHFENKSTEEELMVKELNIKLLAALLGNSTNHLSVADLSLYVDALFVTCQNPNQFYGHDLLKTLKDRVIDTLNPLSEAILTLCIANYTIPEPVVLSLMKLLEEESDYPFFQDIQATAVMALNCIRRQTHDWEEQMYGIIYSTTEKLIAGQNLDGSFGTVYSTALITQALLSSEEENNYKWNFTATVKYLMNQLQFSDIVESYLVLPILNGKTLLDISNSHCIRSRQKSKEDAVTDITSKLGQEVGIQFSLYVGDLKDDIITIHLSVPEKSTAYDVLRLAESIKEDQFEFSHRYAGKHLYVYSIGNVSNDPRVMKFWLLYATESNFHEPVHFKTSPDKFIVKNGMHLIMWYRSLLTHRNEIVPADIATEQLDVEIHEQPKDDLDVRIEDE